MEIAAILYSTSVSSPLCVVKNVLDFRRAQRPVVEPRVAEGAVEVVAARAIVAGIAPAQRRVLVIDAVRVGRDERGLPVVLRRAVPVQGQRAVGGDRERDVDPPGPGHREEVARVVRAVAGVAVRSGEGLE